MAFVMFNLQLVFFLNILVLEKKGLWFQLIKLLHKYITFLLTSFLSFLMRVLQFLVMQGTESQLKSVHLSVFSSSLYTFCSPLQFPSWIIICLPFFQFINN